jgi:NAD kinase
VVVPDEKVMRIELAGGEAEINLSADGQTIRKIAPGTPVEIRKADYCIKLVRKTGPHSAGFYDKLRAKLHWGEDVRKQ